ncbi:uncharacterized protein LOC124409888 [Diprion similis]|uniref:uncharacterized protein LOC124409888 n=1 Tax=Diprion similis TaxID=362088 RepID=UPI001EF8F2C5|nr:uncharacterized protein LOC124409888 [Diprion similis]
MLRRRSSASLCALTLAAMCISPVRSWINTYKSDIHPEYPGSCYDADSGAVLTPGVTMTLAGGAGRTPGEHCVSKTCIRAPGHSTGNDARSELFVKVERCTPLKEIDGCEIIPGHEDLVYPSCCPRLRCIQTAPELQLKPAKLPPIVVVQETI